VPPSPQVDSDNLYERLEVGVTATTQEIKRAYQRLLRLYPPERAPEQFKRIREAYETLIDPHRRKEYDSQPDPVVRELLKAGMAAMSAKRYQDAERHFKRVLIHLPDLGFVRNHLGLTLLYQQKAPEAIAQFERLVRTEQPAAYLFGNLAHAYRGADRFEDAARAFQRAIELAEDEGAEYYVGLANVFMDREEFDRAQRLLEMAIRRDGQVDFNDLRYFTTLLEVQLRKRDYAAICDVVQRIQGIVQDDEQSRYVAWKLGTLAGMLIDAQAFTFALLIARSAKLLEPDDDDYEALVVLTESVIAKDFAKALTILDEHQSFRVGGWLAGLRAGAERFCRENKIYSGLQPVTDPPPLATINGIGFALYGERDPDPITQSHIATYYFVILFIPIIPLACYRVIQRGNRWQFLGKAPLSAANKRHLWILLGVIGLFILRGFADASTSSPSTYRGSATPVSTSPAAVQQSPSQPESVPAATGARAINTAPVGSNPSDLIGQGQVDLRRWIGEERQRLATVSSQLDQSGQALESQKTRIDELKRELRRIESDANLGVTVDRLGYERVLQRHNVLVDDYNSRLETYRAEYARYKADLADLNRQIDAYNARLRLR
jgi:tetratricopeptide (TPR) repeat protein